MTTRSADSVTSSVVVPVSPADVIPQEVYETARRLGVLQYLPQVIEITAEVYGGFSEVSVSFDPEVGDEHIEFRVPADCTIEEALDLDEEWDRRIAKIIPRSPQVYLTSVEFKR